MGGWLQGVDQLSTLSRSHDIITIGMTADEARRSRHGLRTTFVRVESVSAEPGSPVHMPDGTGEMRIAGTPASRDAAVFRVKEVAEKAGKVPVSAYSLADLESIAARDRITLRSLLEDLRAVGLELVAEAPFDDLQDPRRSIEEVNIAGLTLARLTVNEPRETDLLTWYKQVAALQRTVSVIRAFAPLPRRLDPLVPTTGYDDLKRIALARLLVDNVPSIQIDWSLYGPKLSQVALTMGADDLDGVSASDDQSLGRRRASLEEVRRNIRAAGQEPVERDGRFDPIVR
jgi:aminodeoxyfutalosine synthase